MQVKMQKIISVSIKNREELKKKYQCSQTTLYNALAYKTMNRRADVIRQDALDNFGGVESKKPVLN